MLKFKSSLIALVLLMSAITSCSKSDDTPAAQANPIEGKWQFSKEETFTNNQEALVDYQHTPGCTKDYIELLSGNVLKEHYFENNGTTNCQEIIDVASWSRNNNTLTFVIPNEPTLNSEILDLTPTTLKIKFTLGTTSRSTVFTRIN